MRLDKYLSDNGLTQSRTQSANLIRLGKVFVNGRKVGNPAKQILKKDKVRVDQTSLYVSRGALKLKSVAKALKINFKGAVVLDVGSSTGGFTQFALEQGAIKSIAVELGTDQLHSSLKSDERIELHEKTDIRKFAGPLKDVTIALIDVSFVSLRNILPSVKKLCTNPDVLIIAMVKPQFEADSKDLINGVIKNSSIRRRILKNFEVWASRDFKLVSKQDSGVSGQNGNVERFYILKPF